MLLNKWHWLRKIIIINSLFFVLSTLAIAGDGPLPPPLDAPKSQQEFTEHLVLAEKGRAYSQYIVCLAYYDGRVIKETNYAAAIEWCTLTANQGYYPAQYYLGRFYLHGNGVEKDIEQALYWFKLSEENENHGGTGLYLGDAYKKWGRGREKYRSSHLLV